MLFACSIENARMNLGAFDSDRLVFESSITTDLSKSVDEYAILPSAFLTYISGTDLDRQRHHRISRPTHECRHDPRSLKN